MLGKIVLGDSGRGMNAKPLRMAPESRKTEAVRRKKERAAQRGREKNVYDRKLLAAAAVGLDGSTRGIVGVDSNAYEDDAARRAAWFAKMKKPSVPAVADADIVDFRADGGERGDGGACGIAYVTVGNVSKVVVDIFRRGGVAPCVLCGSRSSGGKGGGDDGEEGEEEGEEKEVEEKLPFWSVLWTSTSLSNTIYATLDRWKRVNQFPGSLALTRKDAMATNLPSLMIARAQRGSGSAVAFAPETYVLPRDATALGAACRRTPNVAWIVKPAASSQGRGIHVAVLDRDGCCVGDGRSVSGRVGEQVVVARYIGNPLLLHPWAGAGAGHKFDLRVYVLVTSVSPLRAYVHPEGLVRFAAHAYSAEADYSNTQVHLTNYSVARHDPGFRAGDDTDRHKPAGHKWALEALWNVFAANDGDNEYLPPETLHILRNNGGGAAVASLLKKRIDQVVVQALLGVESQLAASAAQHVGYDGAVHGGRAAGGLGAYSSTPLSSSGSRRSLKKSASLPPRKKTTNNTPPLKKTASSHSVGADEVWGTPGEIATGLGLHGDQLGGPPVGILSRQDRMRLASEAGTCFQLLGLDILIDQELRPWLLEANLAPSLATPTPLDHVVKSRVISDTLNLACVPCAAAPIPVPIPVFRGSPDKALSESTSSDSHDSPTPTSKQSPPASEDDEEHDPLAEAVKAAEQDVEAEDEWKRRVEELNPQPEDTHTLPAGVRRALLDGIDSKTMRLCRVSELEHARRGRFRRVFPTHEPHTLGQDVGRIAEGDRRSAATALAVYLRRAGLYREAMKRFMISAVFPSPSISSTTPQTTSAHPSTTSRLASRMEARVAGRRSRRGVGRTTARPLPPALNSHAQALFRFAQTHATTHFSTLPSLPPHDTIHLQIMDIPDASDTIAQAARAHRRQE